MTSTDLVPQTGVLSLPEAQQREILLALGLDIRSPLTRALLLVAERYDLDPLLKQIQVIKQNVYITHAGLLHIAHVSGKLDGIVVEDESEDKDWYRAVVSVYRKDMTHPFRFGGKFRKSRVRADGATGEEMALKNAERSALRRAFDVTAPTMDDSGQDMDDIPPGNDIDLPQDKPALPGPEANALPVPQATAPVGSSMPPPPPSPVDVPDQPKPAPKGAAATRTSASTAASSTAPAAATPPTTPASAANGASAGTKVPTGSYKVTIPETGEVVLLSESGSVINPTTGGEVLAATEEQQALQARAREIVAQAEADLKAKNEKPVKRAARATKKAAPPNVPQYTEEEIKRGQVLHMVAKEQGVEETLLRDVVYAITDKRTRSTREVSQDEYDTIRAVLIGIGSDVVDLDYDAEGNLSFDMMDNPLPPDDAEEDIPDAEVVTVPVDWQQEARERSVKDGMFLRKARALAEELGLPLPSSFRDISGEKLEAALWEWLTVLNA